MNEPMDTRVVTWLAGLLAAITTANGYHTDAGVDVRTERLDALAEDVHGVRLAVEDVDETALEHGRRKRQAELTCTLHALVPVTVANARQLCRRALADMRRALAGADRDAGAWPVGVTSLVIGNRIVSQREESAHVVSGELTVTVKYTERFFQESES